MLQQWLEYTCGPRGYEEGHLSTQNISNVSSMEHRFPNCRFLSCKTGEHYAKWNKPGGERQIPYDLTYKWNLIDKTSKQAKYNQKHWNKEQNDRAIKVHV